MSWITPTEADIIAAGCSAAELDVFRSVALGVGQPDPLDAQIANVVYFMRGYLRRCSQHIIGEDGTIPAEGLQVFCDLIVPIIQKRPAGALIDSENHIRLDAKGDSIRWLERAAKCEILFDDSVPAAQPDNGPIAKPSFNRRKCREDVGI